MKTQSAGLSMKTQEKVRDSNHLSCGIQKITNLFSITKKIRTYTFTEIEKRFTDTHI